MATKMYNVKNRSAGMCVYRIPEMRVRRVIMPGQTIQVSYDELKALSYEPGGKTIMVNFLQISDTKLLEEFNVTVEPEYNMSEQDVITLLQNGSLDEFLDALDFAPDGVIDLIKNYAVKLPVNDSSKRKAIKEKTGFDVDEAIRHNAEDEEEEQDGSTQIQEKKTRRVNKNTTSNSGRRTSPKKYEVVDKD